LLLLLLLFPPYQFVPELSTDPLQDQATAILLTPKEFLKDEIAKQGLFNRDFEILSAIISCESGWEQKYENEEVKVSNGNIGLAQINRSAHEEEYTGLGLDPYDEFENIKYAIILYKRNGIRDWEQWSGHCFIPLLAKQGIIIK
jgi:hypothetical protein